MLSSILLFACRVGGPEGDALELVEPTSDSDTEDAGESESLDPQPSSDDGYGDSDGGHSLRGLYTQAPTTTAMRGAERMYPGISI